MKITTTHTLVFSMCTKGSEQHTAAAQIAQQGAAGFGLQCTMAAMPLPEGADPSLRYTQVTVTGDVKESLEVYAQRVDEAMTFIGVELGE